MKWLENNPIGTALLATSGLLVSIAVVLSFFWGGDVDATAGGDGSAVDLAIPEMPEDQALGRCATTRS